MCLFNHSSFVFEVHIYIYKLYFLSQLIRTPFMKFMYHSASFGSFLFLLFLASTNVSAGEEDQLLRQDQRGPVPTLLEMLVVFYVLGKYCHLVILNYNRTPLDTANHQKKNDSIDITGDGMIHRHPFSKCLLSL